MSRCVYLTGAGLAASLRIYAMDQVLSGWLGAYVSEPIVLAKLRSASNAALLEMTNREAIKTCALFSSWTIGSVNLTGDTWQSNRLIFAACHLPSPG